MQATIRHAATAQQREFIVSDSRVSAFIAGIGSGKTRASILKALKMPAGTLGMLLSPTYTMLRDTMLRTFLEVGRKLVTDFNKSELHAKLINGSEILFRSADNPERLRGPNLAWAGLDEAALMTKETLDIVVGRLRKQPGKMWFTTTPKGKTHWLYGYTSQDSTHVVRARTMDNPYLPKEYLEELKRQYTADFYAQEVLGEFVDFGGTIFSAPTFYDQLPNTYRTAIAYDAAYTAKSSADYSVILVGRESQGKLYVTDMWRGQVSSTDFVARLRAIQSQHGVHAYTRIGGTEKSLAEWLRQEGVNVHTEQTRGDKLLNAQPTAAAWNRGDILLPKNEMRGEWPDVLCAELNDFTGIDDAHDDIVDTLVTLERQLLAQGLTASQSLAVLQGFANV
ncbi:MAG: phage terminase large subunit [Deinococcota bacterium]